MFFTLTDCLGDPFGPALSLDERCVRKVMYGECRWIMLCLLVTCQRGGERGKREFVDP